MPEVQSLRMETPLSVIHKFVACINAADVAGITSLMTEDHRFIDATGGIHSGRQQVSAGWTQYFGLFPDYHIEIESAVGAGDVVAAFGWVSGSFHGESGKAFKFPAAFRGTVRDSQVAEWRVYADIESMLRSMGVRRFEAAASS